MTVRSTLPTPKNQLNPFRSLNVREKTDQAANSRKTGCPPRQPVTSLYQSFYYCLTVTIRKHLSQLFRFHLRHLRHLRKRKRYAHRFIFFQTELPERKQLDFLNIRIRFQEIHQLYHMFFLVIDARNDDPAYSKRYVLLFYQIQERYNLLEICLAVISVVFRS